MAERGDQSDDEYKEKEKTDEIPDKAEYSLLKRAQSFGYRNRLPLVSGLDKKTLESQPYPDINEIVEYLEFCSNELQTSRIPKDLKWFDMDDRTSQVVYSNLVKVSQEGVETMQIYKHKIIRAMEPRFGVIAQHNKAKRTYLRGPIETFAGVFITYKDYVYLTKRKDLKRTVEEKLSKNEVEQLLGRNRSFVYFTCGRFYEGNKLPPNPFLYYVLNTREDQVMAVNETLNQYHKYVLTLDGQNYSWLVKQLTNSEPLRKAFLTKFQNWNQIPVDAALISALDEEPFLFVAYKDSIISSLRGDGPAVYIQFVIRWPKRCVLDLLGNRLANSYVLIRSEMDTALSWLSTLGGAFSALGDNSVVHAKEAGLVSIKQLKIAMKIGDPLIAARCRLYASISLLQRGYLETAKGVIKSVYGYALSLPEHQDPKLIRMCLGVWAKLQYVWKLKKDKKCADSVTMHASGDHVVQRKRKKDKDDGFCSVSNGGSTVQLD